MDRIGGALATLAGTIVLLIGAKPAYDVIFNVANETVAGGMTSMESMIFRFLPIAIPLGAVVGGIILITRHTDRKKSDRGYTEW